VRSASAAAALAVATMAFPAAAFADDASAERAYRSNDVAAAVLERRLLIAYSTFDLTGRAGPLLHGLVQARALIIRTRRGLISERASTPAGAAARAAAFRALSLAERAALTARAAVLVRSQGEATAFRRLKARAEDLARQAAAADRSARALFAAARATATPRQAA
jgi:hypothetical protein